MSTTTTKQERMSTFKLQGTLLIIGAERGIGEETCMEAAAAGSNIAILYRESKDAPQLAERIRKEFGVKAGAYKCDETEDMNKLLETLRKIDQEIGQITRLVVNTRETIIKPANELTTEDFKNSFGMNTLVPFKVSQAVAKHWSEDKNRDKEKDQRSIVFVTSVDAQIIAQASQNKPLTQAFYSSSMAGTRHLARGLASEWARDNVRVNAVSPGYVDIEDKDVDEGALRHLRENVPLRRLGRPEEIARLVVFVASPYASYLTGSDVVADGGLLIW